MTDKDTPLLIYDGDCGFCTYWVDYWQKLTGESVQYRPYQNVAAQFPDISVQEFQSAVQYVAIDGKISRAAEASFLTLSHAPGNKLWLWLYRKIPGFAFVSEKSYLLISKHREFFYKISLFLWGREHEPPRYDFIAWLFLRLLGVIFFSAFVSFGVQALGLIGSQGILPVSELADAASQQLGIISYWLLPMVFWINSSDFAIQATCWGGALLSLLLIFNIYPRASLLCLYILYLSLCSAGQIFMSFQWDMYLLETGIIAIFLLCYRTTGIWLLRWLLFRFMFGGGIVKILSGDPAWRDFSALSYYFMTEPLPTPLAWYADHLPEAILKACTASALFIELVMPFFIFFPRKLRFISGFCILSLQSLILITGNYNFFNLLTLLLCLTLFDDAAIKKIIPHRFIEFLSQRKKIISPNKFIASLTGIFVVISVYVSVVQLYFRLGGTAPTPIMWSVDAVAPLRMVNLYGPFAVITKTRMEIIIEGSDDGLIWREYSFRYKPGDVNRRPPWNIPHQPRLDWQMWFAALGTVNDNQWFLRVLQRILENSPTVLGLLENNPFPHVAPRYMRALFYKYDFTTPEEGKATGAWWKRDFDSMYVPSVHLQ